MSVTLECSTVTFPEGSVNTDVTIRGGAEGSVQLLQSRFTFCGVSLEVPNEAQVPTHLPNHQPWPVCPQPPSLSMKLFTKCHLLYLEEFTCCVLCAHAKLVPCIFRVPRLAYSQFLSF